MEAMAARPHGGHVQSTVVGSTHQLQPEDGKVRDHSTESDFATLSASFSIL